MTPFIKLTQAESAALLSGDPQAIKELFTKLAQQPDLTPELRQYLEQKINERQHYPR